MRQRKAKDLYKRLQDCSEYIVDDPTPDTWADCFGDEGTDGRDLYAEIGCGKGNFIIRHALMNPEGRYVAFEGQETVILRAAEKAMAVAGKASWPENVTGVELLQGDGQGLPETFGQDNLRFVAGYVNDMNEFFRENSLAGVYLNFSDPWPKARHYKRRLTYRERLMDYAWAIKPGGFIEIKTDNDGLYDFTLEEIEACSKTLRIIEETRDLHASNLDSRNYMTEYEAKFSGRGKNINYVKVLVKTEE